MNVLLGLSAQSLADEGFAVAVEAGGGGGSDGHGCGLGVGWAGALAGFAGFAACHDVFWAMFAVFGGDAE